MRHFIFLLAISLFYQTLSIAQQSQLLTDRLFFDNEQSTTANLRLFSNGTLALTNLANERLSLATNNITRLTILGEGDIGIGTSLPDARLEISDNSSFFDPTLRLTEDGTDFARLQFRNLTNENRFFNISARPGSSDPQMEFVYHDGSTSNNIMTIQGDESRVGILTTSPAAPFHAVSSNSATALIGDAGGVLGYFTVNKPTAAPDAIARFRDNGTTIMRVNPGSFTFQVDINGDGRVDGGVWASSDKKLKQNIEPLEQAMESIMRLQPKTYLFRQKDEQFAHKNLPEELQFGLIAQELKEVFPNLVRETPEYDENGEELGYSLHSVNYTALIPVLVAGMQEQQEELEMQEARNRSQQEEIEALKIRLAKLEQLLFSETETGMNIGSQTVKMVDAELLQNQPNPFSDETTIRYVVPKDIRTASLQITDAYGKIVKEIAIHTKGEGQTLLQAQSLSAGTYFYTLILDGKITQTKQMVLTK